MQKTVFLILTSLVLCTGVFAQTQKELYDNGVLFFKKHQYQKAIDAFSKLIEIAPDHADAYKNRGVSYLKQQKFDFAIKDFQTAKKLFPELKGLYSNLGVAWYYKKEYAKAIENYNTELEMAPENHVAYFNRALCLAELDKEDAVLNDLEKALTLKPDFYWAICYKADLLAKKGKTAKAIETYKEAIKNDSQNAYAKDKLAKIEKTAKAIETYKKAIKNDSQNAYAKDESAKIEKTVKHNKKVEKKTNSDIPLKKKSTILKYKKNIVAENSEYTIQTGAFLNKVYAMEMKATLINMGFDSRIITLKNSKNKTWYFVRSGNYSDRNNSLKDFTLLKEKLDIQPVIKTVGHW